MGAENFCFMKTRAYKKSSGLKLGTIDLSDSGSTEMPVVRYFQIHFEELHNQLSEMQENIKQLQKQLKQLNKQSNLN